MNTLKIKIALWSARICLLSFIIWIISFIGIALSSPLFIWSDLHQYLTFYNTYPQFFSYFAKIWMIFFSISFMVLILVWEAFSNPDSKILTKIGSVFAILFAICSSLHYFVQISSVRFALNSGNISGLDHFLQANPTSFSSSVNMLGWGLFLGLSNLFLYFESIANKRSKGIKLGFLIVSISCLLGCISFLAQIDLLTFLFINLGLGGGMILLSVSSIRKFKKI
ncbi:MAG: hypothetical protein H6Q25_865 [Bacteroidetes bacterium]|nr:hypothetical protein [Bacteroidota bacterium]